MPVGLVVSAVYLCLAGPAWATAPSNQGLPWVSGSFAQGQVLTASAGDWLGSQPLSAAYQWQRCTPYKDGVLADSPAAYWRLGEAQGAASAVDQASSPDNGAYTNSPTLGQGGPLSGDPDRAVRFDGAGAFVDVADASKLKPASAFSLEAWVKTTASNGVIVDKPYTAGALVSYSLSVASGKAKAAIDLSGSHSYSLSSAASVNDGNWHQVVETFGSATLRLYVDGSLVATSATTTGSLQYSTHKLQIGRFDASGVATQTNATIGNVDKLYVANSFADTVTRIDLETSSVTGTIKVDRTPVGAALAPAGDRLYVSNRGAGTVSVLGVSDGVEWARIPVGDGPGGCAVDPLTGHLLVANAGARSLTVVEDLLSEPPPALPEKPQHELLGRQLPPFRLPDLRTGMMRTSREWAERKYILNFFASW